MPWFDDFYYEVEKLHGIEKTKQVADSYLTCIDWVEQVVKDEGIDCHFARVDGHLFPHEESDEAYKTLKKVVACVIFLPQRFLQTTHNKSVGSKRTCVVMQRYISLCAGV